MTLTSESMRRVALILLALAFATGLFMGNQRHAEAENSAAPILCTVEEILDENGLPFEYEVCEEEEEGEGDDDYGPKDPDLVCWDGIDNDEDGFTDWGLPEDESRDPDCNTPVDDSEEGELSEEEQCVEDGGFWNGEGCDEIPTCSEGETYNSETNQCVPNGGGGDEAQCDDGLDNDSDGLWDMEDPGCSDLSDDDETDVVEEGNSGGSNGGGSSNRGGGSKKKHPGLVAGLEDCSQFLTDFLKFGANNNTEQVNRLQMFFKEFEGMDVAQTGIFDAATLSAVHAFQAKYMGDVMGPWGASRTTGYVYLTTRKKVNELYCKGTEQFPLTEQEEKIIEKTRNGEIKIDTTGSAPATRQSVTSQVNLGASVAAAVTNDDEEAEVSATSSPRRGFWGGVGDFFSRIWRNR